jgi:hypothetical protein
MKGIHIMKRSLMLTMPVILAGFLAISTPAFAEEKAADHEGTALEGIKLDPKHGICPFKKLSASELTAFADERVVLLKKELAITGAQDTVWGEYAKALKHNLETLQSLRGELKAKKGPKSALESYDLRITALDGRISSLKELKPTLTALYGALSEEQKKKADRVLIPLSCIR